MELIEVAAAPSVRKPLDGAFFVPTALVGEKVFATFAPYNPARSYPVDVADEAELYSHINVLFFT